MSKASDYMGRVAKLPCVLCAQLNMPQYGQTFVHHCFDTSDRSDYLTIPLCYEHHQGGTGFHGLGQRMFQTRYKTSETKLLAMTIELLAAIA